MNYYLYIDSNNQSYEFTISNCKIMLLLKIIGDCGDCEEYNMDDVKYRDVHLDYGSEIGVKNLVNLIERMRK